MSFEKYQGSSRGRKTISHPCVKIWSSGKIAFNDVAVEEWLDNAEYVGIWTHSEIPQVAIAPSTKSNSGLPHVYALHTQGTYNGKLLQVRKLLRDFGCSRPDESLELDAWYDDDREMMVVDLDPLT